jgi:hypothetical protein
VSCACVSTPAAGGLRSGRERNAHVPCCGAGGEPRASACSDCAAEVAVVEEVCAVRPSGSQPGILAKAIHAAPAPAALSNFLRVNWVLRVSVPGLSRLLAAVMNA